MNWSSIRTVLASLFYLEAGLLFIPFCIALGEGELSLFRPYILSIAILIAVATLLFWKHPQKIQLYNRDGMITVALCWIGLSVFGALPFYFSGSIPSLVDAVFEMASGFTTTGSTILRTVEDLPRSLLFWRSFSHLIGGMGVLVLALAILPGTASDSVHLMRAEIPGPSFGKLVARIRDTARILYLIYLGLTAILVLILVLAGMNLFDALIHAFGAAGTGGFSNYTNSVAHFNSPLIEMILAVAMIIFGVNFNLYYTFLLNKGKRWIRSEELNWYLGIIAITTLAIAAVILPTYGSLWIHVPVALKDSFFAVSSIITTSGYCTVDFGLWPLFARTVLLFLMFVGASAGSTGGGFKASRLAITFKAALSGLRQRLQPHRVVPIRFEDKPLSKSEVSKVIIYLSVYLLVLLAACLLITLDCNDMETAFSAVMATLNNVGPGLGKVGPSANFADLSAFSKIVLTFCMIAGRLELYPMLALFSLLQKPRLDLRT